MTDDGRLVCKKLGTDFSEATRIYVLATTAGKKAVTLICANIGFPPPDKYADHQKVLVGRRKSTGAKVYRMELIEPRQYQVRMMKVNKNKDLWWCPYCRKLRRFVRKKGRYIEPEHIWLEEDHYACPMCKVSHKDGRVKRYNPIVGLLAFKTSKTSKRTRAERRRRRQQDGS